MNFLKGLFGGGSGSSSQKQDGPSTINKGLEDLEEKADMLKKRIAHLEKQVEEQDAIIKKNASTNKTLALDALREKKYLEKNIVQVTNMLRNIKQQKYTLENASTNAAILKAMSQTAKIVKKEQDNLDMNQVEDIMDQMRERQEISDEIANIIGQDANKGLDDDQLLAELEDIKQEEMDEKLKLPNVPTKLPEPTPAQAASTSKKDEDELEELKKWASAAQ